MVEQEVIREKLKYLAEYIDDLEQDITISLDDFLNDKKIRRYIERTLHMAIECCLDIGSHIISCEKLREPESNKDIFNVLAENNYIPPKSLTQLGKMAQFRNLIVHSYTKIDPEIVYTILKRNIKDLKQFAGHMHKRFLES
ncbi:type VII toxin-antitoxin system HepT family RNase toxin [Desulfoscipio geothermicus]|uniref:Uncharacterized conserved protein YutE, UPF0331/DUF86 family n=1 Tax=Desulfoscipio geothermicus DSM 3669 TaxID=1121426 RepID=A0A1I6DE37_9FIRM|nr:DUF86 domain-containing protein [Desulfoscipio geothermicus]SFR03694.1 Uncharacterized conserved protein YutE, UPF0331/DUF86 family [Desulfoscipio geothermicus DSM 3669]